MIVFENLFSLLKYLNLKGLFKYSTFKTRHLSYYRNPRGWVNDSALDRLVVSSDAQEGRVDLGHTLES